MNQSTVHPTRIEPTRIAPDTYVIHAHQGEGHAPVCVPLNSMLIRGSEPVVVDTGMSEHRDQYFADLFELVDPLDIRWVFISHDDIDHTGNLNELMQLAPRATVVVNWFVTERMGAALDVPPTRWRWLGDGESLDVGDRRLRAIRPPVYDAPTTRGLFDPTTGVYWASDAFSTPMPTPVRDVTELDGEFWEGGRVMFDQYVSPWLELVDDRRYQATVDRIESLCPTAIAGCHTPVIGRAHVGQAIATSRRAPHAEVPPQPDQAVLDQIQRTLQPAA